MNCLSFDRQCQVAAALVEGTSIRSASRILRLTPNAVARNSKWIGMACQRFHDRVVRGLKSPHIETDEVFAFLYAKTRNLPDHLQDNVELGDFWTWISLCRESRLIACWHAGKHGLADAIIHMEDLAARVPGHLTISTDQLAAYRTAIEQAFGNRVDYATIQKKMGPPIIRPDGKYEQPDFDEARCYSVYGNPDLEETSTNRIERQNLTLRMSCRRYDQRSNAFSKKMENHRAALALHFCFYNFCRVHSSIRCTPAMEAGLSDHIWEIEELVERVKPYEGREVGYLNRKKVA